MAAFEAQIALPAPDLANDRDGLLERAERLAGPRRGPPYASMASQKPPAPRPSSKRPPLSRSIVAAAFAMTAGGRSGKLATSGKILKVVVDAAIIAISDQVSAKLRW